MKVKALLFATLLFAGASAFAQEASKGPFVTNDFGSNWFLGGGVGVNSTVDGPFSGPQFGFGFAADLNFGKWIDPMWGIRAGVLGINSNHLGENSYNFAYVHGDVMWNITNQFWGYKQNRVYQAVPYLTAGLYWPSERSKNFGVGAGLLNKIRLSDRFDLDIDLMGVFVKQASIEQGYTGSAGKALAAAATVGVSYKFGTHTWETKEEALTPATVAAAEAAAALAAAQASNEKLAADKAAAQAAADKAAAENEALKNELSTTAAQNAAIVKNLVETPAVVYFEIGQATLSVKEQAHFERIVKTMLDQNKNITFTITGLTDHNTGSVRRNKQLQKQRTNYIVKLLTEKYNLNKDQFEVVVDNSKTNKYLIIELNRAVVIEAAK